MLIKTNTGNTKTLIIPYMEYQKLLEDNKKKDEEIIKLKELFDNGKFIVAELKCRHNYYRNNSIIATFYLTEKDDIIQKFTEQNDYLYTQIKNLEKELGETKTKLNDAEFKLSTTISTLVNDITKKENSNNKKSWFKKIFK